MVSAASCISPSGSSMPADAVRDAPTAARSAPRGAGSAPRSGAAPRSTRVQLARALGRLRRLLLRLEQPPRRLVLLRAEQDLQAPVAPARRVRAGTRPAPPCRRRPAAGTAGSSGRARGRPRTRPAKLAPAARGRLRLRRLLAQHRVRLAPRAAARAASPARARSPRAVGVLGGRRRSARARRVQASTSAVLVRQQVRGGPAQRVAPSGRASSVPPAAIEVRDARRSAAPAHVREARLLHERAELGRLGEDAPPTPAGRCRRARVAAHQAADARQHVTEIEPIERAQQRRAASRTRAPPGGRRAAARAAASRRARGGPPTLRMPNATSAPSKQRVAQRQALGVAAQPGRARASRPALAQLARARAPASRSTGRRPTPRRRGVAPQRLDQQVGGARAEVEHARRSAAGPASPRAARRQRTSMPADSRRFSRS